jgi:hypothetical protein
MEIGLGHGLILTWREERIAPNGINWTILAGVGLIRPHLEVAHRLRAESISPAGIAENGSAIEKRLMGFEPTTFCMAISEVVRRTSVLNQLICRAFVIDEIVNVQRGYARIGADMQRVRHFSPEVPEIVERSSRALNGALLRAKGARSSDQRMFRISSNRPTISSNDG